MEKITGGKIGTCGADNLIAGMTPAPSTFVVELKTAGEYARGTVLSLESDGTYEVLGKGTGKASAILERTAYTEDGDFAIAYRSGHFNRAALIMNDSHTLSAEEENDLRLAGIILSDHGDIGQGAAETAVMTASVNEIEIEIESKSKTKTAKTANEKEDK